MVEPVMGWLPPWRCPERVPGVVKSFVSPAVVTMLAQPERAAAETRETAKSAKRRRDEGRRVIEKGLRSKKSYASCRAWVAGDGKNLKVAETSF
jgi:hypothetical protein